MSFFYELVDSSTIRLWERRRTFDKTYLEGKSVEYAGFLALSDSAKWELIVENPHIDTLEQFNSLYEGKKQEVDEIISYWDYNVSSTSFDRITGNYVTPLAVNDKCGEDATNVAINSINGNSADYWQHDVNEAHWIVYDLGMSLANIVGIGIVLGPSDGDEFKLQNVNVYVSDDLNDWGDAVGSNLSFQVVNSWNSESLTPKKGRYVKVENINTLDTNNYLKVREVRFTHQILDI